MTTATLEDILKDEQDAIISGRYDDLAGLQKRKEDALSALDPAKVSSGKLRSITSQIDRNQSLLSSAIKGISAARTRLETLTKSAVSLTTYDQSGEVQQLAQRDTGFEKKA